MNSEIKGVIVLGFGPQPIDLISKASKVCGENAVIDTNVARMAGAIFAFGQAEPLIELRNRLEAGALMRQQQETPGLSSNAIKWLASGFRGISSNTIFSHLTGIDALGRHPGNHPADPSDLDRCLKLLDEVPELKQIFPKMAEVSPEWASLVANWETIKRSLFDEVGPEWTKSRSAPRTYDLMKSIISEGEGQ